MKTDNRGYRRPLTVVGIASILMAVSGMFFNSITLFRDYSLVLSEFAAYHSVSLEGFSNFYPVFYTLSSVCVLFYVLLFVAGVQLVRGHTPWVFVLLGTIAFEVLYYILLVVLRDIPPYGQSITVATGISSGGLVFQLAVLFPLWAPVLALWARYRIIRQVEPCSETHIEQQRPVVPQESS